MDFYFENRRLSVGHVQVLKAVVSDGRRQRFRLLVLYSMNIPGARHKLLSVGRATGEQHGGAVVTWL